MIPNAKNNNFIITFPKKFFYPDVIEKYEFYIKRLKNPYLSVPDYVNSSIQGITVPGVDLGTVDQVLLDDFVKWKDGFNLEKSLEKTFTISFKQFEGYLNYWIMFDQLQKFYSYDVNNEFFPPMTLSLLDNTGFELVAITFYKIIGTSLSSLELSYASNIPEFQTFDMNFSFNYFKVENRLN
jgi:hypothetical protein